MAEVIHVVCIKRCIVLSMHYAASVHSISCSGSCCCAETTEDTATQKGCGGTCRPHPLRDGISRNTAEVMRQYWQFALCDIMILYYVSVSWKVRLSVLYTDYQAHDTSDELGPGGKMMKNHIGFHEALIRFLFFRCLSCRGIARFSACHPSPRNVCIV